MSPPPTSEERELILKFREAVKDLGLNEHQNSDPQLLRWIREKDLNLNKAEEMIRNSMKWRKDNDIDNIFSWKAPDWIENEYPFHYCGFTKKNEPIFLLAVGALDYKKLHEKGEGANFVKYMAQKIEKLLSSSIGKLNPETNYPVTQVVSVFDADNYSYGQLSSIGGIGILIDFLKMVQNNYPLLFKKSHVINASKVYRLLFNIVKPIINKNMATAIKLYSENESEWAPILLEDVQAQFLPLKSK